MYYGYTLNETLADVTRWMGFRAGTVFPSPFVDVASQIMPESIQSALDLAEYIFMSQPTYRTAVERVISYFLTDVDIEAARPQEVLGEDVREKWQLALNEHLNILGIIKQINLDEECYGNAFVSLYVPFDRMLRCPKCQSFWPLKVVYQNPVFKFVWRNFEFHASCPQCATGSGYVGPFIVDDRYDTRDVSKLRIKRWNPKEILLVHEELSGDTHYFWRIPGPERDMIRKGILFHLERAPVPVIEAIRHNALYAFNPDFIYHVKKPTLAGIKNRGWGLPPSLVHFRQLVYLQVLHKFQEKIAFDYILPLRIITPVSRAGEVGSDYLRGMAGGDLMAHLRSMIRRHRVDPASWHVCPWPLQYVTLGGDGRALAPHELLEQAYDMVLNGMGVPVELYRGSLQIQAAPVALRLFEATFQYRVAENNRFLRWLAQRIAKIYQWENVRIRHRRVTHSDDIQKQMALLQLMMSRDVSKTTVFKALGLDARAEARQVAEDIAAEQEIQYRMQEEMDRTAFGKQIAQGMMPGQGPPGAPMDPAAAQGGGGGGAGSVPVAGAPVGPVTAFLAQGPLPKTPEEMSQAAEALASQLLGLPEGIKDSELRALKQKNEVLHALVAEKMEQIRRRTRLHAGAMVMGR